MDKTDKDDFWDIGKLMPKKTVHRGARFDTSSVDVSIAPPPSQGQVLQSKAEYDSSELKLTSVDSSSEPAEARLEREYSPENAFILKVGVYTSPSPYRYYEDFERTMHKYLRLTVKEAEKVPFFSYVPQYSQLSKQRLSWYLYWRSMCRRREYVQTDLSYIILYIYELINFDNPRHPDRMIDELCSLWRAYRGDYPQLDRYLPDWVCDYCLIHAVRLPFDTVSDFIYDTLENSTLKGFYYGSDMEGGGEYTWGMICVASLYSYKKSKYYTPENKEAFDVHIKAAVTEALREKLCKLSDGEGTYVNQKRDVYVGALCTASAKRTLYIEHIPFTQSHILRSEATLAVKYAENKLRGALGIKSRLSVSGLEQTVTDRIDSYFAQHFGTKAASEEKKITEPEYMAYYESQTHGVELSRAADIEERSWETATLMCESFDGDGDDEAAADMTPPEMIDEQNTQEHREDQASPSEQETDLDACEREVLSLILSGKSKQAESVAASHGRFLSGVCERINGAALDIIGDIAIEQSGGEYRVLLDYEEEVSQWLK